MDEEAETKAIEKWLQMVDKPLETKVREIKSTQSQEMNDRRAGVMAVMTDYLKSKQRKSTERCPVRPGGVSVQGGWPGG